MKLKLFFLLNIFLIFSFLATTAQTLTQEEKDELINSLSITELDSMFTLHYAPNAIEAIIEYVVEDSIDFQEAIPSIVENIWKVTPYDQTRFIRALYLLNATETEQIALAFIDSVNYYENVLFTKLKLKILATSTLFELGNYSNYQLVFDELSQENPDISSYLISMLSDIISNIPSEEIRAKNALMNIVEEENEDIYRYYAISNLAEHYGEEMNQFFAERFVQDEDIAVVNLLYRTLFPYKDEVINSAFKTKLPSITEALTRNQILTEILFKYGAISDFRYVLDYQNSGIDPQNETFINAMLNRYMPPLPVLSTSILDMLDDLINLTDTVSNYTWLGDLQFEDELQSTLQSAKTNLLAGDSLVCVIKVKAFQDSVDYVYADSLNTDPRFVTLGGWKFLYWNAQYILDRLPEIPEGEVISTYSIFATHSVWIRQDCEILSGSVGVNEAGEGPFLDSELELSVGKRTTIPSGYTVKGNRIKVKQDAAVNADVYYNELTNNGTITGTLNTPLEFPLIADLPEFHSSTPGTEDIIVPRNGEYILLPGSYNDIEIKRNGKLIFTGGEYNINNIDGSNDDQLLFQSSSEVKIKDKFYTGQRSYIGPQDTTTLSADEIVFYIEGINGSNGTLDAEPKASKVGADSKVKANFYVPNGTMWIRLDCEAEGSFIGKDVKIGASTTVKLNSAW